MAQKELTIKEMVEDGDLFSKIDELKFNQRNRAKIKFELSDIKLFIDRNEGIIDKFPQNWKETQELVEYIQILREKYEEYKLKYETTYNDKI